MLVNNADWLDSLGYVEFLRTVGAQVTVNRMLSFESVKQQVGAGSSRCPSWSSTTCCCRPTTSSSSTGGRE